MKYKKQQGFSILLVLLLSVMIIVAVTYWANSGKVNTSVNTGLDDTIAATLINQSTSLKISYDQILIQEALHSNINSNIVFLPGVYSTLSAPNVLDPVSGSPYPIVPRGAVRSGGAFYEGIWIYNPKKFQGNLGDTASSDPALLVVGIKDNVCRALNKNISGKSTILSSGVSNYLPNDITVDNPTTAKVFNISFIPQNLNTTIGCFGTSIDDYNIFLRVVKIV